MPIFLDGKQVKELHFQGQKIGEAWYEGKCVYQSAPVEVIPGGLTILGTRDWLRGKLQEYGKNYRTVTTLPFNLDTSQVTDMFCMFFDCSSLTQVPDLDTSQVTNMAYMFYGCSSLTQVPDLDTSQVTNMAYMFYGCSSLTDGKARLIRKDGTKPRYRDDMIINSGLTREPFFRPDGTPIN